MTVVAPLKIGVSFSKRKGKHRYFYLNLNQYRNEHFQILNKAKVNFKEQMSEQIRLLPKLTQIEITYVLHPGTHAKIDVSNVCAIVDKFFCDALVEMGIIPDDNFHHVPAINYRMGHVDKDNPRIDIKIRDLSTNTIVEIMSVKEQDMQIILAEDEILSAIEAYVRNQITVADSQEIKIDLKAGRGENGYSATLDIRERVVEKSSRGANKTASTSGSVSTASTKPATVVTEKEEPSVQTDPQAVVEATETKEDPQPVTSAPKEVTATSANNLFGDDAPATTSATNIFGDAE